MGWQFETDSRAFGAVHRALFAARHDNGDVCEIPKCWGNQRAGGSGARFPRQQSLRWWQWQASTPSATSTYLTER